MNLLPLAIPERICEYLLENSDFSSLWELGRVSSVWREGVLINIWKNIELSVDLGLAYPIYLKLRYGKYVRSLIFCNSPTKDTRFFPNNKFISYLFHEISFKNLKVFQYPIPPNDFITNVLNIKWPALSHIQFNFTENLNWSEIFSLISLNTNILSKITINSPTFDFNLILFHLCSVKNSITHISFKSEVQSLNLELSVPSQDTPLFQNTLSLNSNKFENMKLFGNMINHSILLSILKTQKTLKDLELDNFLGDEIQRLSDILSTKNFPDINPENENEIYLFENRLQPQTVQFDSGNISKTPFGFFPSLKRLVINNACFFDTDIKFGLQPDAFPVIESLVVRNIQYYSKLTDEEIYSPSIFTKNAFTYTFSKKWFSLKTLHLPSITNTEAELISTNCPALESLVINAHSPNSSKLSVSGLSKIINNLPNLNILAVPKPFSFFDSKSENWELMCGYDPISIITEKFGTTSSHISKDKLCHNPDSNEYRHLHQSEISKINWKESKIVHLDLYGWEIGILDLACMICLLESARLIKISISDSIKRVLKNNFVYLSEVEYLDTIGTYPKFNNTALIFSKYCYHDCEPGLCMLSKIHQWFSGTKEL
ncbi:hypothetical protein BB558_003426 [Smittium angustum]|uniref:F-box domain-containing protein n=1 Tax=Smittium angustum TaxID=133377 RepID=A0A2U1J663_SMIAN|nr:hypothetical protein BB558_003426 [Smittium angustum]